MFEQFKNLIKFSSNSSVIKNQKHENELIQNFIEQSKILNNNPNLPQKAKFQLENITFNIKQIDIKKLPIEVQVKIERILSKDIPFAIETYLSIPKAHAVSVILENGKTAKQTLIDQLTQYTNLLSSISQEIVEMHSKMVVQNEKINNKISIPKKDFFDL